jgi:DNA-binding beta-propeller fold protein YncE
MKTGFKKIAFILLVSFVSGFFACAPTVKKENYDIVWPLPPEKPRIKFVDIIRSNKDVEKSERKISDFLLGAENVQAFLKPHSVYARAGKIYVSDIGRVWIFDTINQKVFFIGDRPGVGKLKVPIGIAVTGDGRIFISDPPLQKVFVYESTGKFITVLGKKGDFHNPSGLALDEERRRIYVVSTKNHSVSVYSLDNYQYLMTIGTRGPGDGEFNFPTNVTVDSEGNILVVDTGNWRVQKFDPEGNFIMKFGGMGDLSGQFVRPKGIAVDSEDHIYVVDAAFGNVQIFDSEGRLLLWFGAGGMGPGTQSVLNVTV